MTGILGGQLPLVMRPLFIQCILAAAAWGPQLLAILLFVLSHRSSANGDASDCETLVSIPTECRHFVWDHDGAENNKGIEVDWMPHFKRSGRALYNMSLKDATFYQTGLVDMAHFGNALSPYWYARALAVFGGLAYKMVPVEGGDVQKDWYTSSYFLKYLPTDVPRRGCANLTRLKLACCQCHQSCLTNPHKHTFSWPFILDTIRLDTQMAFKKWSSFNNMQRPNLTENDVVIQDRCDDTTLLHHHLYGPIAFSFYASLKTINPHNIFIIRDPNLRHKMIKPQWSSTGKNPPFYPCRVIHEALCNHLTYLVPNATIHSIGHKDISEDWAFTMYAPVLFKSVSTFTLWSGLASDGLVYSTPLFPDDYQARQAIKPVNLTPHFGLRWHWVMSLALVQTEAARLSPPKLTLEHVDRIIAWLMHN